MDILMYFSAILAVGLVIYMLIKNMDIKITLFMTGIILMFVAIAMGKGIALRGFQSTGSVLLDPLYAVIQQFKSTLTRAGLIILVLGGYSVYMTTIGANDVTVNVLSKPIGKIKSQYILVPIVFLLGNLLSLVIPSASQLGIILLATLYPVLKKAKMSTMSAAAVIATAATVMPTPLGSDNVAITQELVKFSQYSNLTVTDYVFKYHALVSVPTLFVMAVVHYFWQKHMDKKYGSSIEENIEVKEVKKIEGGKLFKTVYAILPLLPILLLLVVYFSKMITGVSVNLSVEVAAIFSFIVAIICELIRHKGDKKVLADTNSFFKGMGNAISIVALLVAATVFVVGLKSIGLISSLQSAMIGLQGAGVGFVLPLILVSLTAVIVLLSGSGTALFFAMVPLMVPLAVAANINPMAVTVPMGLAGNLLRAVSPVSAVVVIVSGYIKKSPFEVVKRTCVPMVSGVLFMFVLSMIVFL